jgi:acetyltransferase-like isoleucine patch superfamily enzyme
MSLLWTLFDGGSSIPQAKTPAERFMFWCGRRLALRHPMVFIGKTSLVHPEAKVHPRAGTIRIGENCKIAAGVVLQGNVIIGDNCSLQTGAILVGYGSEKNPSGLIRIGNGVRIAPLVMIVGADHVFADPDKPIHRQALNHAPITIDDDVWIAGRVNITCGVTIGRGCVVGGGSVVTRDLPPFSIAVGSPARVVKSRKPDPTSA